MSHPKDAPFSIVHPAVLDYLGRLRPEDDPLIERMEAVAAERHFPLIGRQSGYCLELLATLVGARRVFEFGSGFGYSAFFFARAVGPGGTVVGCDRDAHEILQHRALFAGHPVAERIDLRVGDAFAVLSDTDGDFDVFLLDLDKADYRRAFDAALSRIRPGGLILADNTLWGGKVTRRVAEDGTPVDHATASLQAFNAYVFEHPEVSVVILPVGDGLSVIRRDGNNS